MEHSRRFELPSSQRISKYFYFDTNLVFEEMWCICKLANKRTNIRHLKISQIHFSGEQIFYCLISNISYKVSEITVAIIMRNESGALTTLNLQTFVY